MTRRIRFLAALAAAAALLFSQLAVSAYACPMAASGHAGAMAGCDEVVVNVNLCERHCDYGSASFELAKPLQAPAVAIGACLRIILPDVAQIAMAAPAPHIAPGPAPPAPLERFTVLRI